MILIVKLICQNLQIVARLPRHAENSLKWSQLWFRVPMAIETPSHEQRFVLIGERHFVDAPVTFDAPDAFVYMNTVVEVSKFGQVVNPFPCDRHASAVAGSHGFKAGGATQISW